MTVRIAQKVMERDRLEHLICKGLSSYAIATEVGLSQTAIRHWLKKHGLKTQCKSFSDGYRKPTVLRLVCSICDRNTRPSGKAMCASCRTKIRRMRNKLAAVRYLGGKCYRCGYSENPWAFQFHHLRDKEFPIGHVGNKSWRVIKAELDKCKLVCANCHQIEHCNRDNKLLLAAVMAYRGPGLT